MNNHAKRVLVAVFTIPLIIIVSFLGGLLFFGLIAIISALALLEYYKLSANKGIKPQVATGLVCGLAVNLAFYYPGLKSLIVECFNFKQIPIPFPTQTQLISILLIFVILMLTIIELFRNNGSAMLNLAVTIFGIVYIPLLLGTMIGLRELFNPFDFPVGRYFENPQSYSDPAVIGEIYRWGAYTVISVFAIIWICDSAAYYVGSAIGKHKIFPRVSPKKSWEGSIAGFIFAVIAAVSAKYLFLEYLSVGSAVIVGVIVGIFGQIGDLAESLLKRDACIKDSSSVIPGHGGILDRFDSLIFAAPLVYIYIDYILFS